MKGSVHRLKTVDRYWDAVERGEKTFGVRLNDRAFQTGDTLELVRTTELGFATENPPRVLFRCISYLLQGGQFGIEPRYCVLGLTFLEARNSTEAK